VGGGDAAHPEIENAAKAWREFFDRFEEAGAAEGVILTGRHKPLAKAAIERELDSRRARRADLNKTLERLAEVTDEERAAIEANAPAVEAAREKLDDARATLDEARRAWKRDDTGQTRYALAQAIKGQERAMAALQKASEPAAAVATG
jgi:DNA repair exonuclease SbcCD ATPase subunit